MRGVWSKIDYVYTPRMQGRIQMGFGRIPKTTHPMSCMCLSGLIGLALIFGQQNLSLPKILASRVVLKGAFTNLGKISDPQIGRCCKGLKLLANTLESGRRFFFFRARFARI